MEKKLEELVFIIDKSGSMSGKEEDTIGSFNSTIKEHSDKEYDVLVTSVLFSDDHRTIHDRIDIKEVNPLTSKEYVANGCTALIDAMGDTISHIKDIQKYQRRKEDIPEHTIFIIITDGLENASSKYSSDAVKAMVEQQKEKGWDFVFLGANIDAVETAKKFSIDESRAINYICDEKGFKEVSNFTNKYLDMAFELDEDEMISADGMMEVRKCIDLDYLNRNKKKTKH